MSLIPCYFEHSSVRKLTRFFARTHMLSDIIAALSKVHSTKYLQRQRVFHYGLYFRNVVREFGRLIISFLPRSNMCNVPCGGAALVSAILVILPANLLSRNKQIKRGVDIPQTMS